MGAGRGVLMAAAGLGCVVCALAPVRDAERAYRRPSGCCKRCMASVLLLMLWHPALSVATLRPQQNIVAVVVDDSASMAQADEAGGVTREGRQ